MKQMMAIVLVFSLLVCVVPFAFADESALRVLDSWGAADAYREAYPDRTIETLDQFDENGVSLLTKHLTGGEWDAVCFDTDEFSLAELDRLGLVYNLNENTDTAAVGARLYPSILAGCSVNGKLAALPAGYIGTRSSGYRLLGTDCCGEEDEKGLTLREQLGFGENDQPTNFAEVCALGLRYMALSREQRKGTVFLFSDTAPQGYSLLYNMILTYQAEATDDNGTISFDTPAFHAALAAADPLLTAFAADPKRTYGENRSLRTVMCDCSGVLQSYGVFPTITQEAVIPAYMTVVIVNPNSSHLAEALDYALLATSRNETEFAPAWYANIDYDALLAQSYDRVITAQIEEGEEQSVIDKLEAMKSAGDDTYFVPRATIEHYKTEIMPKLVFRQWRSIPITQAIFDYLNGKTDADNFIAALNDSAAMAN